MEDQVWLRESQLRHRSDAKALADELFATLPGGTLDALLCEMIERKACLLRVPLVDVPDVAGDLNDE